MGQQFVGVGPAHQVVAQHLVRAFGRLAASPEVDQQAGDDRAVRFNRDPVRVMTQQMPAAQQVFERAEEDLESRANGRVCLARISHNAHDTGRLVRE